MRPSVGSVMRLRILSRVDLPAPLRPMMPTTSPCLTSKETSLRAQKSSEEARADDRTTGLQDDRTTGLQDDRTTGLQDDGPTGLRDPRRRRAERGPRKRDFALYAITSRRAT